MKRERTEFQFHYGTIKRMLFANHCPLMRYFNSTMVRLKGFQLQAGEALPQFQFHYGTIKRRI